MKCKFRYCVANVYVNCKGKAHISYYSYNNAYGLHLCEDINDEYVLWYGTREEAQKRIMNNTGECVIERVDYN